MCTEFRVGTEMVQEALVPGATATEGLRLERVLRSCVELARVLLKLLLLDVHLRVVWLLMVMMLWLLVLVVLVV